MTEKEIIRGCIKKSGPYQRLLFEKFSGKMMSVCLRYTSDEQQAQDMLQEGFIKVFNNIYQYRFDGSFEGWLRRVFVTTTLRLMGQQKIFFSDADISDNTEHSIDPDVLSKISADEIHALIRNLPNGYRTIFNLSVIEGYTHEEIASMLGIQATTSRGQLLKARKHLQQLIIKKENKLLI